MDIDEFDFIKCQEENGAQLDSDMKLKKILTVIARTEEIETDDK